MVTTDRLTVGQPATSGAEAAALGGRLAATGGMAEAVGVTIGAGIVGEGLMDRGGETVATDAWAGAPGDGEAGAPADTQAARMIPGKIRKHRRMVRASGHGTPTL